VANTEKIKCQYNGLINYATVVSTTN